MCGGGGGEKKKLSLSGKFGYFLKSLTDEVYFVQDGKYFLAQMRKTVHRV